MSLMTVCKRLDLPLTGVNYELVYTAPLTKDMTLGDIWERFNIDHPADFKGHSLSVSDIVVLHQNDEDTAPLCRQYRFSASAGVFAGAADPRI